MVPNFAKPALKLVRDAYRYVAFPPTRFRGVYADFRQAEAAAPRTKKIGYNHKDVADKYKTELELRLDGNEYPALFHLTRILTERSTVLDLGGNIGIHYLRYRKYFPINEIDWIVCDLPEINRVGREVCVDIPNIKFIDDVSKLELSNLDVLMAIASLQCIETPEKIFAKLINKGLRPQHILIDHIPLQESPRFVTLQNGGLVYYPMYVFNRREFIASFENHGFSLVDVWRYSYTCHIPFHPEKTVGAYSGLYFADQQLTRE